MSRLRQIPDTVHLPLDAGDLAIADEVLVGTRAEMMHAQVAGSG